jgi:Zn finger protein HypA/HybF involved in hydrogenase expression
VSRRKKIEKRKTRKCLNCDRAFEGSLFIRLCTQCKSNFNASGADTGYRVLGDGNSQAFNLRVGV